MDCFRRWMEARGSRDVQSMLAMAIAECSWKTAPDGRVLASLSDLFFLLFSVCNNGVLPREKSAAALTLLEAEGPIKFVPRQIGDWSRWIGEVVRIVASKYREISVGRDADQKRAKVLHKVSKARPATPQYYTTKN
jgi:hypothetical protein